MATMINGYPACDECGCPQQTVDTIVELKAFIIEICESIRTLRDGKQLDADALRVLADRGERLVGQ